jgi:uncharacterized repeat protein (TIGR01451 family)
VIVVFSIKRSILGVIALSILAACGAFASQAVAADAWWQLNSISAPANLQPGGEGKLLVRATNLGSAEVNGSSLGVTLKDRLPAGLTAISASGSAGLFGARGSVNCSVPSATLVECGFEGTLPPYEQIEVEITVAVHTSAELGEANVGEVNEVAVSGGEAQSCNKVAEGAGRYTSDVCNGEGSGSFEMQLSGKPVPGGSAKHGLTISAAPVKFGVEAYELTASNEVGSLDTQAGSHPFGLTTTLMLNRTAESPYQPALPKDLDFRLPPGLIGNPTPFPQCTEVAFLKSKNFVNECPAKTALGVAVVTIMLPGRFNQPLTVPVPLFNLKPSIGEPARFGFEALAVPVILDTSVRTGDDYGVTVSVDNITQTATFLGSQVTFWGVPGDPEHDSARGWQCLAFWRTSECAPLGQLTPPPLLSLPTSCTGPLQTTIEVDSWAQPGSFTAPSEPPFEPSLDGCNRLPFEPSISVAPDGQQGSTPTGLTVGIRVPQDSILNPTGLAEANVKDTAVALPAGVALNPAAADGLEACSEEQIALSQDAASSCPEASKVGTVEIKSPLLPNALTGAVYLAAQNANPFGSLVALYLVAQDPVSGTLIKVAGEVKLDPVTGQLISTFKDTPQLPFEELNLHFFGGDRAPLATPASCGAYTTTASVAPWSGNEPATPSSTFDITSGPNATACASPLPFTPSLAAGTTSIQAGGFTPFTMTMSREDGQQNLQGIQLHMPAGLSGLLSGVKLCGETEADAGTCGPESEIGETTVSVGLGGDPYSVRGGRVYITGPYGGAPFGLSIVVPAKAGPYDLGQVVVRGKIEVDPITSALTVTTDNSGPYAIPQILDGIPLQIKHVNFTTTRPGFTFNPTNCDPESITGSLESTQGTTSVVSVPFQVTNCAILGFKPGFSVSTAGKTSRANGASLSVRLTYPKAQFGSQANIRSVKVDLPKQLPSRLTTLQKACTDSTFEQNPANCPVASRIGQAKATTPLIPVPLTGPVYFVSHGGAKFPELVIVLQGYGVTVDLHSETFINKAGITSSTFRTIPDVPVGTFELVLPQGKYSALAANGNLCASTLKMPTAFTAQNGAVIKQSTPVSVTGCPKHVRHERKKPRHKRKK